MGRELGRISGPLLSANLLRRGKVESGTENLAFHNNSIYDNYLYIDVLNDSIGIRTTSTSSNELNVNGTTRTTNLIVDTNFTLDNDLSIFSNKIKYLTGEIIIQPDQGSDPTVLTTKIGTANLRISDKLIENITSGSNIELTANGTGEVVFNTSNVVIDGTLEATGTITWDGDITIGSDNNDSVSFVAEIASNIIPDANSTYDLGTSSKVWKTLYATAIEVQDIVSATGATANDINLMLPTANTYYVSVNGDDSYVGNHVRATFKTVKQALLTATSGDEVVIFPGTYTEDFPLTVPQGVSVRGAGIRSVTIQPSPSTNTNNAFLLNGETTISFLTVKDFYTGYAFSLAPGFTVTSRSPYIQNVTVITNPSVLTTYTENRSVAGGDWSIGWFYREPGQNHLVLTTNMVDPGFVSAITATTTGTIFSVTYVDDTVDTLTQTNDWDWFGFTANLPVSGFNGSSIKNIKAISWGQVNTPQDDAGNGALVDGSLADSASNEASMLFHGVTMIVPGASGVEATNGARVEWLNSFTYYAYRGIYLTEGTLGFASLGLKFGAEMRSINSANVYGTYGAVADGASTLGYLIGHNFGYVGSGTNITNDPKLVIQANEIVELNDGVLYYDSMDHKGDYRIGNVFFVEQSTGRVVFDAQRIDFTAGGSIVLEGPSSTTYIDAFGIQTGNIKIHDNNIDSLLGPVNFVAQTGTTTLNTDVTVTGFIHVTGDSTVHGNVYLGDTPYDTVTIFPDLTQTISPKYNNTYTLGSDDGITPKRWDTLFLTGLDVDGIIDARNNTITTLTTDTDLEFIASGTGKIHITSTDVQIDNSLTVGNNLTINGTTSLQDVEILGTTTLTGDLDQQFGSTYITGLFANHNISVLDPLSYLQVPDIKIENNTISATATNSDLNFVGLGSGGVVLDEKLKIVDNIISNVWASATTDTQKSIIFSPDGTGNVVINSSTALALPYGNTSNRTLSEVGEIRQNSTTKFFEGWSPNGLISFNDIYDSDRNTYVTAELTPYTNDNILRFGVNSVVKAEINSTKLYDNSLHADNVSITGNTITNLVTSNDLEILTTGTGTVIINDIPFKDDTITNLTNDVFVLGSTGGGYIKFVGTGAVVFPIGPTADRRPTIDCEVGEVRYNTTLGYMEVFDGTNWIAAAGTQSAATQQQVIDIMDEWTLILG